MFIIYLYSAIKDPPKIPDLVRKIYRVFIPNLLGLTDPTRSGNKKFLFLLILIDQNL
jgi:hypothetical protein